MCVFHRTGKCDVQCRFYEKPFTEGQRNNYEVQCKKYYKKGILFAWVRIVELTK